MMTVVFMLLVKLLNEHEKELIEDEFFKAKERKDTEDDGQFTEHHLDTSINELTRNETSKSVILAPFNSTQTEKYEEIEQSNVLPKSVMKFMAKVREVDRQFERNNNCEVDNGVYNKEDVDLQAGEANKNSNFDPLAVSDQDKDKEYECKSPREEERISKRHCIPKLTEITQLKIDSGALSKVESFGFPKTFVENSLIMNETNHATTTYFLLIEE